MTLYAHAPRCTRSLLLFVMAAACGPALAIFQNGGFESSDFTGWTLGGGSNPGLAGVAPFTGASIQINAGTPGPSALVAAGTVDANAPDLVLARLGQYTAKLNDASGGALVTTMTQVDTVTNADIDASDNLPHIRFSYAPVLDDPGHSPHEQPYFYVVLKNLADNSIVFEQFAYSGQPGVQFLNSNGNWKYLPFQDVDVALPMSAIGQQIELTVVAADCSLGAHGGYVYVDGFGSASLPPAVTPNAIPAYVAVPTTGPLALLLLALAMAGCGWFARRRTI
ncbi:MAG TPA: IPTL-CTERM sorting domain-containing protein [Rhodanobacteraceae bacterium]|nr:IPTL-CTERM sorting domain-containing protein [Rhodanobacteraceae bacterium]